MKTTYSPILRHVLTPSPQPPEKKIACPPVSLRNVSTTTVITKRSLSHPPRVVSCRGSSVSTGEYSTAFSSALCGIFPSAMRTQTDQAQT